MKQDYAFINGFRAAAAFWVLGAHCMIWGGWYGLPLPTAKIAVDLFMMISGFLMAANAAARCASEPMQDRRNWVRFWLRRFFRLAPAYYLSLFLAVASGTWFLAGYRSLQELNPAQWGVGGIYDPMRVEYTTANILMHLSFLFGLHPTYSFSTFLPDWSLSLEMQFYWVFPLLWLAIGRFGFLSVGCGIGVPLGLGGILLAGSVHYAEPSLLLLKLNYFMAGILLFRLLDGDDGRWKRGLSALCGVLLVSLDWRYGWELLTLPILFVAMMVIGRLEVSTALPRLLFRVINSRGIRWASDVSYGVYLFHGFFISLSGLIIAGSPTLLALSPSRRVLVMFVFVSVSAYAAAHAIHRWIEKPGIRLGGRVIRWLAPSA